MTKSSHAAERPYTTDLVTSRDGTIICYRQLGRGPGMVLLHGGMSSAHNHIELAQALADAFSVYVTDRRGRCASGPFGAGYCIRKEVEDLEALLGKTGASNVFGVSSGGLIVLEAARSSAMIQKAAIFEPALFLDRSVPAAVLKRLDAEMEAGNIAAALITGMKGAQMGPAILRALPRRFLELLANTAIRAEDKHPKSDYVPVRALVGHRTKEINWIEANGNYARLHVGVRTHEIRETLNSLERKLDPRQFLRIHRSTIVNVHAIKEMHPWFHGYHLVLLQNGQELRMSRYQSKIAQQLGLRIRRPEHP